MVCVCWIDGAGCDHKWSGAAAFINGIAIAILTALGVLVWSSSEGLSLIILTTVTDVVGFFAFLGIATLLSSML